LTSSALFFLLSLLPPLFSLLFISPLSALRSLFPYSISLTAVAARIAVVVVMTAVVVVVSTAVMTGM
jgi:hypothetical protein